MVGLSHWRGSARDMSLPPYQPTNSSRNLCYWAVCYGICVFQNNRVTFVCLKTETRMTAGSMHVEQIPSSIANCPAPMPEKWFGNKARSRRLHSQQVGILPRPYLSKSLVLVLPSKRSFDDWSNSLDNQKVSDGPLCTNIVRTANH